MHSHSRATHHRTENAYTSYLVEYIIALPARRKFQLLVQTLGGKFDQDVPAAMIVALTRQTHHLTNTQMYIM